MLFSEARWTFMCFNLYITVVEGRKSSICALKGSSVNLSCSAQHATSDMSWYIVDTNGSLHSLKEPSADGTTGTYSMAEETNFTLTIHDVRDSDAKLYCCKESTENPEFCSNNQIELHVAELQVKVIPATEGQTVTLMCITLFHTSTEVFSCAVKGNEDVRSDETCVGAAPCWAVNYFTRRICALEGSSVTINSKNSLKYYSWHKVKIGSGEKDCGRVLHEVAGHVTYDDKINRILRINDVMRNDSGEYKFLRNSDQCRLPGVMLVVTGLKVTVTPSAVVTEGQRVTLTCSTSCPLTHNTNYIWYLNGRPLILRENQNKHLILDPVSCDHEGNYSCAVNASQMISSAEEGLTVKALEKTVAALNALKMTLLSLIPPAAFLLYLRTRKKKTVTATAEQNDREQPGQKDVLYESVALMATKPATQ